MPRQSKVENDLDYYNRTAPQWWQEDAQIYALSHLNPARFAYGDRFLCQWQGIKVLDVGCGGGYTCEFLARRGAIVYGLDRSRACIEVAKEHAATKGFHIDYRYGVAEELPYENDYFDVAVCVDVLEHVDDVRRVLSEIYRILKPGSLFFFDTINRNFWSRLIMIWLLEDWLGEIPRGIHDWRKFITPQELETMLIKSGFQDIAFAGFNLFGSHLLENLAAYRRYRRTQQFQIAIDNNTSIMYIGKALKGMSRIVRS